MGWMVVLMSGSTVTAVLGLVNSYQGFAAWRFLKDFGGGAFVACQYWSSCMFSKNIVGTANAIVAGWGGIGAVAATKFISEFLFPRFVDFI
mmetsp:Transcript_23002/g.43746  ORF Transcript_23002/g.43746 Transcript_23002/m.43746 type:complete len:91 (-) Transcript_23002:571-843(-)